MLLDRIHAVSQLRFSSSSFFAIIEPWAAIANTSLSSFLIMDYPASILSPSDFSDYFHAAHIISVWKSQGVTSARSALNSLAFPLSRCPLLFELNSRLNNLYSPHLLIDGIWLSNSHGGISRIWQQIFSTFSLQGFISDSGPISFIDRGCSLTYPDFTHIYKFPRCDPLDFDRFHYLSAVNSRIFLESKSDVFVSSWITRLDSSTIKSHPSLALVHDCIPEVYLSSESDLVSRRREWLDSSSSFLAVSASTASDLIRYYHLPTISEH